MKEQGQQRVNGDECRVAVLPPSVKSKGPIWSAEQTHLTRFTEHNINVGDIHLKRPRLTATVLCLMGDREKQRARPAMVLIFFFFFC